MLPFVGDVGNCISLAHPVLAANFPKYAAPSIAVAGAKLLEADSETDEGEEAVDLLSVLISDSFSGTVGDPLHSPDAFVHDNIRKVASAIAKCI